MAEEIEIKFRATPDALESVPRLRGLGICGSVKRQKLRSVYFDTPAGKLRKKGLILRVRHAGGARLQTIKSEHHDAFARGEWECHIDSDLPDVSRFSNTPLSRLKNVEFVPIFETVVTRTAIPVRVGESQLEIALDRGHIRAGRRRETISEIEIELKKGEPSGIVHLARALVPKLSAAYEVRTKSERGFALADGAGIAASHAGELNLDDNMNAAQAFRHIGMECLRHVAANQDAVRAEDPEGVHQMRVGLRRLRADMSLFKPMLTDNESAAIKAELKWLTEQLGPARDLDVFMRDSVAPLENSASEVGLLRRDLEVRREAGFEQARVTVGSERYRKLILKVLFWIQHGAWSTSQDELVVAHRQRSAAEYARDVMERRLHKIMRRSRKVKHLEPHKRHKLRIAIKKLRYASEFFAAIFAGKRRRALMQDTLEELQDALGRLNDIAVHRQMASDVVHAPKRQLKAFAMGLVAAHEQTGARQCLSAARKAARQLSSEQPYWR